MASNSPISGIACLIWQMRSAAYWQKSGASIIAQAPPTEDVDGARRVRTPANDFTRQRVAWRRRAEPSLSLRDTARVGRTARTQWRASARARRTGSSSRGGACLSELRQRVVVNAPYGFQHLQL